MPNTGGANAVVKEDLCQLKQESELQASEMTAQLDLLGLGRGVDGNYGCPVADTEQREKCP